MGIPTIVAAFALALTAACNQYNAFNPRPQGRWLPTFSLITPGATIFAKLMTRPPQPLRAHLGQDVAPAVEAVVDLGLRRAREESRR
jgi:hypothetical protein